jgi:hypothetical protein
MIRASALVIALFFVVADNAYGQGACQVGSDRPKIDVVPDPIVFPTPGGADFALGWVMSSTVTVRVNPRGGGKNKPWILCLSSDDFDMGGYGKPLSDLEWQVEGAPAWSPVDQVARLVLEGDGRSDIQLRFRALLFSERDVPGTYDAVLRFTARKL